MKNQITKYLAMYLEIYDDVAAQHISEGLSAGDVSNIALGIMREIAQDGRSTQASQALEAPKRDVPGEYAASFPAPRMGTEERPSPSVVTARLGEKSKLVTVSEYQGKIQVRANGFIKNKDDWHAINTAIKELGGAWIKDGKASRWEI